MNVMAVGSLFRCPEMVYPTAFSMDRRPYMGSTSNKNAQGRNSGGVTPVLTLDTSWRFVVAIRAPETPAGCSWCVYPAYKSI